MDFWYVLLCCITFLFHCDPSVSYLIHLLGKLFSEILWLWGKAFGGLVWQSSLIFGLLSHRVQRAFPKKLNGVDHHLFKHWTIYVDNATLLHCKESVLWDKAAVPVGTLDLGLSAKYDGTVSDCWLYLECLNITLFYWTGDLSQLVHYTFTKSVFWHSPDWHL